MERCVFEFLHLLWFQFAGATSYYHRNTNGSNRRSREKIQTNGLILFSRNLFFLILDMSKRKNPLR